MYYRLVLRYISCWIVAFFTVSRYLVKFINLPYAHSSFLINSARWVSLRSEHVDGVMATVGIMLA